MGLIEKKTGDDFYSISHRFFLFISKKISPERDNHDHNKGMCVINIRSRVIKYFLCVTTVIPKIPGITI
jgi:hypothetical protein